MPERTYCKKDSKSQFDPAIASAAAANTALASRTQAWTEEFYASTIAPLLKDMGEATRADTARQGAIADVELEQMRTASKRYTELGIPAEDRYYKMVDEYSEPEEQERQAQGAIGDSRAAQANSRQQLMRRFSGLGIDPTSPAGVTAMSDMAVQDAAATAAAATRARGAAKLLGMQLKGDAANFGRGQASAVTGFGAGSSSASSAGAGGAQAGVGAGVAGAGPMQGAFGIAQRAYGSNLDGYASIRNGDVQAKATAQAGLGQALGVLGSAAIKSDRRLKKSIQKVATLAHGLSVYLYRYIWEPDHVPLRQGYMADEVIKVFPEAVTKDDHGYYMVDYSKVPA